MQPAQPTLAELVKQLAGLHQTQHQALLDLRLEQEDRFCLLVQAQDEDRRVIRSFFGREFALDAAPIIAYVPLVKMVPQDDLEWTSLKKQWRRVAWRLPNVWCA